MIFSFFSRWKKAGRATGVTGGAGKLCAFDKDGNVISSGVSADDVGKIYQHTVTIMNDTIVSGDPVGLATYTIFNRSNTPLNTWAKLRDATPTDYIPCTGFCEYGLTETKVPGYRIHRVGSGASGVLEMSTVPDEDRPSTEWQFNQESTYTPTDTVKEI